MSNKFVCIEAVEVLYYINMYCECLCIFVFIILCFMIKLGWTFYILFLLETGAWRLTSQSSNFLSLFAITSKSSTFGNPRVSKSSPFSPCHYTSNSEQNFHLCLKKLMRSYTLVMVTGYCRKTELLHDSTPIMTTPPY